MCQILAKKSFVKKGVKKLWWIVIKESCVKGVGKNVVDNFVEKVVGKIKLKNEVDKFGSKVVLKNCMEKLDWKFGWKDRWQILCTNLMEQLKHMGVQFSWIFTFFNLKKIVAKIGFKNLLD